MRAAAGWVLVAVAALTACSGSDGGDADDPAPESSAGEPTGDADEDADGGAGDDATGEGEPLPGDGVDATADASSVVCEQVGDAWQATGVITSSADAPARFVVTVVVAPADVSNPQAARLVLREVEPGLPTPFELTDVPVTAGEDVSCQVQVVRVGARR